MAKKTTTSVNEENEKTLLTDETKEKPVRTEVKKQTKPKDVTVNETADQTKDTSAKKKVKAMEKEVSESLPLPETEVKTEDNTEKEEIKAINLDNPEDEENTKLKVAEEKRKIKKLKKIKDESEVERFNPDIKEGLTEEQVQKHIDDGQINIVRETNERTYLQIILSNVFTFFNTLCFIIAGILLTIYIEKGILKDNITNMMFLVIIFCNTLIGIIQEIKAKMIINKIKLMTSPTATVLRNGQEIEIPITDIVLDDIIILTTGKQIPADCIMVEGEIEANESLLTGESVPLKKKKGAELYSGSFVVSGKAKARVEKVGDKCYNAKLAAKAKKYKKPNSELLKSMKIITRVVGIIIIPLALLTLYDLANSYDTLSGLQIFSSDWLNAVWASLPEIMGRLAASMIGMIPAGMFLLTIQYRNACKNRCALSG